MGSPLRARSQQLERVVLLGAYGQHNLGDDALLEVFLEQFAGAKIVVNSATPASTENTYGVQALPTRIPSAFLQMIRALIRADLVVFGGGSLLKDLEGNWLQQVLYNLRLCSALVACRLARVPTAMVANGAGPFAKRSTRIVARFAARQTTSMSVRDPESASLLRSIGIKRAVPVTADPVLTWADRVEGGAARPGRPPLMTVAPRYSLTEHELSLLARSADRWIEYAGGHVQLIPFQTGFVPAFDDAIACTAIRERMRHADQTTVAIPATPAEAIELLRHADLVVSVRLHALIFAALARVPMAAFSYDPKVAAFMCAIDQADAVVDVHTSDERTADAMIERVWNSRTARAEQIAQRTRALKHVADGDFAELFARFGRPS
jgi:polysaccharide pyruvyl transferase CsaB